MIEATRKGWALSVSYHPSYWQLCLFMMGSSHPWGRPESDSESESESSPSSGASTHSSLWTTSESRSLTSESSSDSASASPQRTIPRCYSGLTFSGLYGFYWDNESNEFRLRRRKDLVGNRASPLYRGAWHSPLADDPDVVQVAHVPTAGDGVYPPRGVFSVQVPGYLAYVTQFGIQAAWCIQWKGPELGYTMIPGFYPPRFLQCDYESLHRMFGQGRCVHMGTPPICLQSPPWDVPDEEIHLDPFIVNIQHPYTSVSQPTNVSQLVPNAESVTHPVILPNTPRGALHDRWPLAKPLTRGWTRFYRWASRRKRARLE